MRRTKAGLRVFETDKNSKLWYTERNVVFRGIGKNKKQNLLSFGETCIEVKNRNPADKNSLLWNFYQILRSRLVLIIIFFAGLQRVISGN